MSRRANISFLTGLIDGGIKGYTLARQIKQHQATDAALTAKPEQSTGYTAEDGRRIEALANAKDTEGNPLYSIATDAEGNYTATPTVAGGGDSGAAVLPSQVIRQQTVTDFMGDRHAGALSDSRVATLRARKLIEAGAMSDPLRAAAAGAHLDQAERLRAKDEREEAERLELQGALRGAPAAAMPSGAVAGRPAASTFTPGGGAPGGTGAAGQPGLGSQSVQDDALNSYLRDSTPRVVDVLVKQGKFEQAKAYQGFIDSQQGREYTRAWADGVRRYSFGDLPGAIKTFEGLYNNQLARDGNTVRLTPGGQEGTITATLIDRDGQPLGDPMVRKIDEFVGEAALYMAPHEVVKHFAEQNAKRATEAALLERQTALETQRQ